ncbi:MAG TPA: hypothetical protein VG266_12495 [Candidatus Dormibacteraeota bacterium]|nr:hypothetical protein [Candidatus Dormibacteraeota bacterium]
MNARRSAVTLLLPTILILTTGGALAARAASAPPTPPTAPSPSRPQITVHGDAAVIHPVAAAAQAPTPQPQTAAPDAGQAHPQPNYVLPPSHADSCEAQPVPHPVGFTAMGGTGTDTITQPDGSAATYTAYARHASQQAVCLRSTGDGGVEVQVIIEAVEAIDPSTYDLLISPGTVTLVSLDPGRAETPSDFLAVSRQLSAWPTSGCGHFASSDLGPRHAAIDDTFCFSANGALRHVDLNERATGSDGVRRDLRISLDAFPNG